jgi:hypothetical protein
MIAQVTRGTRLSKAKCLNAGRNALVFYVTQSRSSMVLAQKWALPASLATVICRPPPRLPLASGITTLLPSRAPHTHRIRITRQGILFATEY